MKRCSPGVICIKNTTIFTIFIIIFVLAYFILYKNNIHSATQTASPQSDIAMPMNQMMPMNHPTQYMTRDMRGDIRSDMLLNPYAPPINNDIMYVPMNVRTQGSRGAYGQVGILTSTDSKQIILPLMGRILNSGRDMWQYYTLSEINNIKLPVSRGKRSCTNEYGCDKLYDGDNVFVQGYNEVFNVTVYDNDTIRYIPLV